MENGLMQVFLVPLKENGGAEEGLSDFDYIVAVLRASSIPSFKES